MDATVSLSRATQLGGGIGIAVVLLVISGCGAPTEPGPSVSGRADEQQDYGVVGEARSAGDQTGARVWAAGVCRDTTVRDLASALGTRPRKDAVLRELTRGTRQRTRRAIVAACEGALRERR